MVTVIPRDCSVYSGYFFQRIMYDQDSFFPANNNENLPLYFTEKVEIARVYHKLSHRSKGQQEIEKTKDELDDIEQNRNKTALSTKQLHSIVLAKYLDEYEWSSINNVVEDV